MTSKDESDEDGLNLGDALALAFGFFLRAFFFFFFGNTGEGPSPIEEALVLLDTSVSDLAHWEGLFIALSGCSVYHLHVEL